VMRSPKISCRTRGNAPLLSGFTRKPGLLRQRLVERRQFVVG
jgi:hypothetical protein